MLDSIKAGAGDSKAAELSKSWILNCLLSSEVALLFRVQNIRMHSEDVMLLDNSELQLMYWLLVDVYSASRVLEAIFVALRQKSVIIINGQSF